LFVVKPEWLNPGLLKKKIFGLWFMWTPV